jgi:RNA polymerase sigma-70 factor (ECF subfamily)
MKPNPSDEQLIDQFLTGQKEDSESAFEALVTRHGPRVLEFCRSILRRDQDAEDAFQATFLVLARKAGTIQHREILGCWLREVAHRIAVRALERRARAIPPRNIEQVEAPGSGPANAATRQELRLVVRAEVNGLPAKYRSLVVHTYMEGKTNEQVARLLRCPVGTVKGRLSRARELLRARLSRRGWEPDEVRERWG